MAKQRAAAGFRILPSFFTMIPRLPAELSALVLDELAQPDVLRLAHVSKSWRIIAIHHSKFYARFTLVNSPAAPGVIETFCSNIVGAAACSARLHITVVHRHGTKEYESKALCILDAIKLALPRLVCLHLHVDMNSLATAATALRNVLQEPAPLLESLVLPPLLELPTNFLDGNAPKLRTLALSDPGHFSFASVFPTVETVFIRGRCDSLSNIGIKFPSVTHVHMTSIIATPDTIPLKNHIPTLRSLHFNAWSGSHIPWVDMSKQTQSIHSITAKVWDDAVFMPLRVTQYVPAFIQCLGAGISLSVVAGSAGWWNGVKMVYCDRAQVSTLTAGPACHTVFQLEEKSKTEVVIRFQSGGLTRTILWDQDARRPGNQPAEFLLENVVPSVASRITHLTFDYLLLPFVAPAVAQHLSALECIEVDFHRLLTDSLQHRDHRLCRHDVLQRHVIDPTDFDNHRGRIQAVCTRAVAEPRYGTSSLALILKSHMPIWFPAHEVLALVLHLDLPSHVHVQNINLVLKGVVEEPEDTRLLRTVFSEVTYVSASPPYRSSV